MPAYYNEFDPYAAQWLRNLIAAGHIAPGDVDERSIVDVQPDDLRGYTQCHFFSGIAGWSLALRLAMWPDDRPVWTGSCPCQPFSAAGKRRGTEDERHLWPVFFKLISECRPAVVLGEQVASKDGRDWLCGVRADLETVGYAVGAADLCAASVGAPHIRQRLWWVADSQRDTGRPGWTGVEPGSSTAAKAAGAHAESGRCSDAGGLADSHRGRQPQLAQRDSGTEAGIEPQQRNDAVRCGAAGGLGHADDAGSQGRHDGSSEGGCADQRTAGAASVAGFWSNAISIPCADGKARRVEPTIQPLAHAGEWGPGSRVGLLRAAGNAIAPTLGAEFIKAWMEA